MKNGWNICHFQILSENKILIRPEGNIEKSCGSVSPFTAVTTVFVLRRLFHMFHLQVFRRRFSHDYQCHIYVYVLSTLIIEGFINEVFDNICHWHDEYHAV